MMCRHTNSYTIIGGLVASLITLVIMLISFIISCIVNVIKQDITERGSYKGSADFEKGKRVHEKVDDFIDAEYDIKVDDQLHLSVPDSAQEYLNVDHSRKIKFIFPQFTEGNPLPDKYRGKSRHDVNASILERLESGKDINWNNRALSYIRRNTHGKHIINCILKPIVRKLYGYSGDNDDYSRAVVPVVDATTNIGGDTILFAMEPFVSSVTSYERSEEPYKMLLENIKLYGMEDRITAYNKMFDYKVPRDAFVIIDPPFETGNNAGNFNLSIDSVPIYEVVQRILDAGAKLVLISVVPEFQYNKRYAVDHGQHVSAYRIGDKNVKVYLVGKDPQVGNFESYLLVGIHGEKYQCRLIRQ